MRNNILCRVRRVVLETGLLKAPFAVSCLLTQHLLASLHHTQLQRNLSILLNRQLQLVGMEEGNASGEREGKGKGKRKRKGRK